jgi:tetratricopeptide (TPR) repeat protein/ubiquinone/menaquinone biosynthesis C-methylase UbiE
MKADALRSELDRALTYCQTGRFREAEDIYRAVTLENPDVPDGWNMLAVVLYQRGALDEASEAARRATELRPAAPPYWLMRGNIALAGKRQTEAQESFRRAIELAPDFAEAHYRLGLSYHSELRCGEATAAYRAALRFAPDVAEIHWQLAEALLGESRVDEAMRAYQEAFARDPDHTLDRRGCFEWLGRLRFDALPAFWHHELERFFAREDIDTKPYVRAGLNALKTKASFRTALARARSGEPFALDSASGDVLADRLFHALLRACLMADRDFEQLLKRLRAALLLDESFRERIPVDFLCALALQNFNNEFVHAVAEAETRHLEGLVQSTQAQLVTRDDTNATLVRTLLAIACYRSLETVSGIEALLGEVSVPPSFVTLLQRSVTDVRIERALRMQIPSIGETADAVSQTVRSMYEENPYPRWFAIDRDPPCTLVEWVGRELPAAMPMVAPEGVRALVAGCGTGRDAIWLATHVAHATVLAVDLSLSSLAHAHRMANALGVRNVEFWQGDILGLKTLDERFDLIASTGVLHHMRDPGAGLASIAALLRPGGLMRLGLYSARARAAITHAREIIAAEGISATEAEIRKFRQRVFEAPSDSPLARLERSNDFYSMSMCRDLLFHVKEHQYTLPEIGEMLRDVDLEFLGFAELSQDTRARYRRMFPEDARMMDLARWDAYEQQYPDTFSQMFLFWCRCAPG